MAVVGGGFLGEVVGRVEVVELGVVWGRLCAEFEWVFVIGILVHKGTRVAGLSFNFLLMVVSAVSAVLAVSAVFSDKKHNLEMMNGNAC